MKGIKFPFIVKTHIIKKKTYYENIHKPIMSLL